MEIVQFLTESLGDASYLVVSGGRAATVDPQRDVRPYLAEAERRGVSIDYVFETHVHNDYLSGGRELAERGARVVVPADSGFEFPHLELGDGQDFELGGARLRAMAAPGHTYEHTAYLALDEKGATSGAFTGGAMLMGAAGRTDLLGPDHTDELTRLQYQSAQRLVSLLPPAAEVLPTHGAGSFCSSGDVGGDRRGPLSIERTRNPLITAGSYEVFRAIQLASPNPIPGYYRHMAPINRTGPRVYGEPPVPAEVVPGQLASLAAEQVLVVDVRDRMAFAAGAVPGSVLIEQDASMLAYFGWLVPFNAPLALVARDLAQARDVAVDLFRIGYEDVRGAMPFDAWREEGRETVPMPTVTLADAAGALEDGRTPVLDVRFANEIEQLPLPGTIPRPIDRLHEWLTDAPQEPALVVCESGYRASVAASFLRAAGKPVSALAAGGASDLRPMVASRR